MLHKPKKREPITHKYSICCIRVVRHAARAVQRGANHVQVFYLLNPRSTSCCTSRTEASQSRTSILIATSAAAITTWSQIDFHKFLLLYFVILFLNNIMCEGVCQSFNYRYEKISTNYFYGVFMLTYWCICVLRILFACKPTLLDTIFEINGTTVSSAKGRPYRHK